MFTNNIPEKELKKLINAITNSITISPEVQSILRDLHKKNLINSSVLMFLALNIQNIDSIISKQSKTEDKKKNCLCLPEKSGESIKAITKREGQLIDGKPLTKKEIEFQEFCIDKFDEYEWLKELGITY